MLYAWAGLSVKKGNESAGDITIFTARGYVTVRRLISIEPLAAPGFHGWEVCPDAWTATSCKKCFRERAKFDTYII